MGCLLPQLMWWCHLVNAHEGKAGMALFAGKTVLCMRERFVYTLVQKGAI